jgi:RND family efflux transporter MFP subunit
MAGLLTSCAATLSTDEANAPPVSVHVETAVMGSISATSIYVARVEARNQVDVMPLTTGRLQQLHVDVGSEVQEGQLIVELNHGTLDAELQQAQATLRNAEAELALLRSQVASNRAKAQAQRDAARARLEQLVNPSSHDLQVATSAVNKAKADLASAKTQLDQLVNPTGAQIATAHAAVAEAESKLSQAQVVTNEMIAKHIEPKGGRMLLWEALLSARLNLQENIAVLENLQQRFDLQRRELDIFLAQQIVQQNEELIPSLISQIEAEFAIPQDINDAMWAETAAQKGLEDAQSKLQELRYPDPNTVAVARHRVEAAQASLDEAVAELASLQDPTPVDLADARAEVVEAEQALVLTQDDHVRHELAAAQALVDQAQAEVDLVKQQLSYTRIYAPFDGYVRKRWLSPGAVVSTQTPIVTISSKDIVVSVQVEESSINSLQPGQLVSLTTPVLPDQGLDLRVDWIAPGGNQQAHTFAVQLSPVESPTGLKPGMSGQVSIETQKVEVVLVPRQAVLHQQGQAMVFVVEGGIANLRQVTTGRENNEEVEVRSGVQAGDQIVVFGQEHLQDGDRVAFENLSKLPLWDSPPLHFATFGGGVVACPPAVHLLSHPPELVVGVPAQHYQTCSPPCCSISLGRLGGVA